MKVTADNGSVDLTGNNSYNLIFMYSCSLVE